MSERGFTVRALGEIAIRCIDRGAMVAFYQDVIGLKPMRDPQDAPIVFFRIADGFEGHTAVLALFRHEIAGAGRTRAGEPAAGDRAGIFAAPHRAEPALKRTGGGHRLVRATQAGIPCRDLRLGRLARGLHLRSRWQHGRTRRQGSGLDWSDLSARSSCLTIPFRPPSEASMSALATLDRLALQRPDGVPLFSGLSLTIGPGRYGLVGRNGSGKSSLLRLLAGESLPATGRVSVPASTRLVEQEIDPGHETVGDALGVTCALATLARLEAGRGTPQDAAEADWTLEARLSERLAAVGWGALDPGRGARGLSGGERIRLMIARALLDAPDLLLLDEPTNNMDAAGRDAVYRLMAGWRGGIVVASHDRALLERVDWIVELTPQGCHVTAGGWSAFESERAARLDRLERRLDRAEAHAAEVADAARNRAERQARRAAKGRRERADGSQPKLVANARKARAEATSAAGQRLAERQGQEAAAAVADARSETERHRPMSFTLPPCGLPAGRKVLTVEVLTLRHGLGPMIGPLSLTLTGPERVALSGPNGAGKTTILRAIAGQTGDHGGAVWCAHANPPFLDQHLSLLQASQSLLENMQRLQPGLSRNAAHAALARFAFRNTDAERPAGQLSGGERLRAALACVFAADPVPELLILDEPTNHLDLDAIEALETALRAYDGAILVVSHDDDFLQRIGIERRVTLPPLS